MRFRYIDDHDTSALERRAAFFARVDRLSSELAELADVDAIEACLGRHLRAIDPELEWELRLGDDRELVLATGGEPRLRPLVEAMVERFAPRDGWAWRAGRPALPFERAIRRISNHTGLDLGPARVRVGFVRAHLLELLIQAPGFGASGDECAQRAATLAVEALLGEQLMERWVAEVGVAPLPRGGPLRVLAPGDPGAASLPLIELAPTVSRAVAGLYAGLSPEPCHARDRGGDWTMLEAEPSASDDWAAQDDLLVATTMLPEMLRSFLCEPRFWSGRFSAHDELFCYVKLDQTGLERDERLAWRSALEDRLDGELAPAGLGAVVGNGFGVRYGYVVLALHRLLPALERVRELCRAAAAPRRSWIQFCDAEHCDEWLAVWPGAPAPPGHA